MLNLITQGAEHIYLACGPTDFRKQIEGLAALVSLRYQLDPYSPACVFLFCNRKKNCLKALRFDKDGFLLATKNCFRTWFFNGQSRKKRSGTSRPSRPDGCWKAYLSNRRKPIRQYGSVRKIRASKVRENAGKIVWIPCKISIFQAFSG